MSPNNNLSEIIKKASVTLTTNSGGNINLCGLERIPVYVSVLGYICTAYTAQSGKTRNVNVKTPNGENVINEELEFTYWYVDNVTS